MSTARPAVRAALLLSRPPIVTADVPAFERAFYEYQSELNKRLMWTFPKWYYFKKGTVAEREFSLAQQYPVPSARGVWFPKGVPDIKHGRDRRFKQTVILPKKHIENENEADTDEIDQIGRPVKANPRVTKADEANDTTSLERKLPRTLYLVVNQSNNTWTLPAFDVADVNSSEIGLHDISENGLRELGGDKINTWSVSNSPAAVVKNNTHTDFIMKSHIVAGKFDPKFKYQWLTSDELESTLEPTYFQKIKHLLAN